jgi:hypothetical protein
MEEKRSTLKVTRRDERRLLKVATEAVKSDFPNPERFGCPGSVALKAIARHDVSFSEAEDVVDHIATCAPCFAEYTGYRRRRRLRFVSAVVLACAAGLVTSAILWRVLPPRRSPRKQNVAQDSANLVVKATLDFQKTTVARGPAQPPNLAEVPRLKRALLNLTIKLPMGMEDGMYSVQFRTGLDQSVANATGTASWDGSAETLTTTIDLRNLKPGPYKLAIRHEGSSWHQYRVVLE